MELRSGKRNESIIGDKICQDFASARPVAVAAEAIAATCNRGETAAAPATGNPVAGAAKHA